MGVAMDLQWSDTGLLGRFDGYVDELAGHLGAQGSRAAFPPLLRRAPASRRAEERGADGGAPCPGDGERGAPVAVALRGSVAVVVGSPCFGGAGFGSAGADGAGSGRGVARQYSGQLGKQDNCQVAVSVSLASAEASLPVAWRLYLPQGWAASSAP